MKWRARFLAGVMGAIWIGMRGSWLAEGDEAQRGKWSLTGLIEYRSPVEATATFLPNRYGALFPPPSGSIKDTTTAIGPIDQYADRIYQDGFVKKDSATGTAGSERGDLTWYWGYDRPSQFRPVGSDRGILSFNGGYRERTEVSYMPGNPVSVTDEAPLYGFGFQLGRDLVQKKKVSFGVRLSGKYFPEREIISAEQRFQAMQISSVRENVIDEYEVEWGENRLPNAPYAGRYEVSGPMIPNKPTRRIYERVSSARSGTYSGGARTQASLSLAELSLQGTLTWAMSRFLGFESYIGVTASQISLDMESSSWLDGNPNIRTSQKSQSETAIQMCAGIGAEISPVRRLGMNLYSEVLLPEKTIEADADPYHEEIQMGLWAVGAKVNIHF